MSFIFRTRLYRVLMLIVLLMSFGTIGYLIIEGWSVRDSLYMTIITISTVGYGEVAPLSPTGELFSMILIVLGVGSAGYTFSVLTDYIVAGELRGALRRQRMARSLAKMKNHYIICGYGRVGQNVVDDLIANRFNIVVVDGSQKHVDELEQLGVNYVIGDATDDSVLSEAGIDRAGGLCMCLPSDADNVFTILSARTLNSDLYIVSRCNSVESERKLRMAGANQVINPYRITGSRMAAQLLHPGAVEFLDVVMRQGELELRIEEIEIGSDSRLDGQTLGEAHVRANTGVNVLAVRRADGNLHTNLRAEFRLRTSDALIGLGTVDQLEALSQLANVAHKSLNIPREP
jgi:voltage-gated potassium channel